MVLPWATGLVVSIFQTCSSPLGMRPAGSFSVVSGKPIGFRTRLRYRSEVRRVPACLADDVGRVACCRLIRSLEGPEPDPSTGRARIGPGSIVLARSQGRHTGILTGRQSKRGGSRIASHGDSCCFKPTAALANPGEGAAMVRGFVLGAKLSRSRFSLVKLRAESGRAYSVGSCTS